MTAQPETAAPGERERDSAPRPGAGAGADTDTAAPPRTSARPALREPQFVRYLAGQCISQLGNQIWYVALSWSAVRLASPAAAGLVLTVASVPRLVLMLFGGVLADRYDIRRLMMGSDATRTLVTLGAAGLALLSPGLGVLAGVALISGIVDAVFLPSSWAMEPRLLKPAQYSGAQIAVGIGGRLALTIGAPLGGVLVAWGGVPLALAVDAATFAVSVATLATVRPRPAEKPADSPASRGAGSSTDSDSDTGNNADSAGHPHYWHDLRSGLTFIAHHPVLGPLVLVTVLTNLGFVGPMNIGLAELSSLRGWGAAGIGVLLSGFGAGAICGGLLAARLKSRGGMGAWISCLGALEGAALLGIALAPSVDAAAAATFAVGVCSGPMAVFTSVLVQRRTPDEYRGRVGSVLTLAAYGVVPLASPLTGVAIAVFGVVGAFAACGAIEAAALFALLSRAYRQADAQ